MARDTIPGADVLGFGFDITSTYDRSSTTELVVRGGKPDRQMTIGGKEYDVPENIATEIAAMSEMSSYVFSTRQEVQDHFSMKAGVTGSGFGFSGHFDASYSRVANSEKSYYYALVESSNHNYVLKLTRQGQSWLDPDFLEELKSLPKTFADATRDDWFAFFAKYGTHYVHQIQLGGQLYYYVAVDKTYSSEETTVKSNMELEYKGLFSKVKVEAESAWTKLGKNWSENRAVKLQVQGGEASALDAVAPSYGEWKGDVFAKWTQSLASRPGVTGFNLRAISMLFPTAMSKAANKALESYLGGGIIVKSDRDKAVLKRREFEAYPTIIGPDGPVELPTPLPFPERPQLDVPGVQVVLFDPETYKVFFNKVHVAYPYDMARTQTMYANLLKDLQTVKRSSYYCAVSCFGLASASFPTPEVAKWLEDCGAKLTGWKKYSSNTSAGGGYIAYAFAGKRGARTGATEKFTIDFTHRDKHLNSTAQYFLFGGVRAKRAAARKPAKRTVKKTIKKIIKKAIRKPVKKKR